MEGRFGFYFSEKVQFLIELYFFCLIMDDITLLNC